MKNIILILATFLILQTFTFSTLSAEDNNPEKTTKKKGKKNGLSKNITKEQKLKMREQTFEFFHKYLKGDIEIKDTGNNTEQDKIE